MDARQAQHAATEAAETAHALSKFCQEKFDKFLLSLSDVVAECAAGIEEDSSQKEARMARLVKAYDDFDANVGRSQRDMFSISIAKALTGGLVAFMTRANAQAPSGSDEE